RVISVTAEMREENSGTSQEAIEQGTAVARQVGRIRLAHERVIHAWNKASSLLNDEENLKLVKMRADIERHFTSWNEQGRNPDYLLPPGLPLLQAKELLSAQADDMRSDLVEYIQLSDRRANAKARRFKITVMAVICTLTILLVAAGIYYFRAA